MLQQKNATIPSRFLRSTRIDTDFDNETVLENLIFLPTWKKNLEVMLHHFASTNQGAFTWTASYGSGKSSLAVAFSALLGTNVKLRHKAEKIFGHNFTKKIRRLMPLESKGWRVLPIVARNGDPISIIGEAAVKSGIVRSMPIDGWTEHSLVTWLNAESMSKGYGGLVIIIDELGKLLEAAVKNSFDIHILQQLAEYASRSNGRLLFIGILHQSFGEYAGKISQQVRDELAKIHGRFVDLSLNLDRDEQIDIISHAVKGVREPTKKHLQLAGAVSSYLHKNHTSKSKELGRLLAICHPLHPVTTCLLGPISRQSFGQNQRSVFSFINSCEAHGFQNFLNNSSEMDTYLPYQLWDYLQTNHENSILCSSIGHRWSEAADAVYRCEVANFEEWHIKLLKTIAIIDLFKGHSGLIGSIDLLKHCFDDKKNKDINNVLFNLNKHSFTIKKKFIDAHSIFAGSDFDIDKAVKKELDNIGEINFTDILSLADIQPVLAKRYYHKAGAMFQFDIAAVVISDIKKTVNAFRINNSIVGQFLLAIPTKNGKEKEDKALCKEVVESDGNANVVIGLSNKSCHIPMLTREFLALGKIRKNHPDLAGDTVARREVDSRFAILRNELVVALNGAFDSAIWFVKNDTPKPLKQSSLNSCASDLVGKIFYKAPILHNELLNRQKPSGSAVAAQNALLRLMVNSERAERLDISGYPAEGGLFVSILETANLHKKTDSGWRFVSPTESSAKDDPCNLSPLWLETINFLKKETDCNVSLSKVYDLWRKPPFGIRDGMMPVLSVAFILSQRRSLAIYREKIFCSSFTDIDVEYLSKDAGDIQLRWMELDAGAQGLLSGIALAIEKAEDASLDTSLAIDSTPIAIARRLVAIYDRLPGWSKKTQRLSEKCKLVRGILKGANDPNKLIFDDLIQSLGKRNCSTEDHTIAEIASAINELNGLYPKMLVELRELLFRELWFSEEAEPLANLRNRASNVLGILGDFRLEAFALRLSKFDNDDESIEGIAGLAVNKPTRDWIDIDSDRAKLEISDMAQKFLRAETFSRIKGRSEKRFAMGITVGLNGRSAPICEEFDIAEFQQGNVFALIAQLVSTIDTSNEDQRNIILAALAETSARYMNHSRAKNICKEKEVI